MGTSSVSAGSGTDPLPAGVSRPAATDPAEIGGYALIGRLGAGGMGVVHLGRDENGGLVAVKVAHARLAGEDEVHARFRAEAACLRRVPADCTAELIADGTDHAPPYIVTEYLAGRSLKDVVERDGPLPPARLRSLAAGVARTLAAIHREGLVHRDLKPANVLLTPTGPRVIDFGIAQQVPASGGPTGAGMVVGTVGWIAPERLGHRPATAASDVFGWGCLVAYAGTGRNPFGVGEPHEVMRRVTSEPPDLGGLIPSLRPTVTAALAKVPADRPTANRLCDELAGDGRRPPGRIAADPPPARTARTRRLTLAASSAVVVAAATVATWTALDHGRPAPAVADRPAVQRSHPSAGAAYSAVISREPDHRPRRDAPAKSRAKPAGHETHPATGKPAHAPKPGKGKKKKGHGSGG
jgi:eukaryotic-like serine/threonine-protein kinase